jgi:dihydroorotase
VQELFPALYTGLCRRAPEATPDERLRIVTRLMAAEPARLFGIADRKGAIAPGLDADLVLFDAAENWSFGPGEVQSKCGWTAYAGWLFTGRVERTIRRGRTVFSRDGGFGAPEGEWLTPSAVGAAR